MDTGAAHDVFIHVRIVMGTVIGLGLTRLLMGTAGLIQHPQRARLSLIHLLWVLSISVELILSGWCSPPSPSGRRTGAFSWPS